VIRLWQLWSDIAGVVLVAQVVIFSLIRFLRWQDKRRKGRVWREMERRLR
jgi:hypothetical protein